MLIDTFANRLKKALDLRNMKQVSLSEKSGIDKSLISNYIKGSYEAKQTNVYRLAKALNVDEAWLMGHDVPIERISDDERKKTNNINGSNIFPILDKPITVPILGKISAGLPVLAVENIIGYEFAPSSYIKEGFEYFYLKVQGDSMNLKFNDGDIVLVQQQNTLENGEIGVILVNGNDATVKKFRKQNEIIMLEPMSTNSEHHAQMYNPKEIEIRILGKVVSYQGKV